MGRAAPAPSFIAEAIRAGAPRFADESSTVVALPASKTRK
jgi:hypothetical protein